MKRITHENTTYFLAAMDRSGQKYLCIQGDYAGFAGQDRDGVYYCPLLPENAAVLVERLPWLRPQPLGLAPSFGFGDRLGLATPGHIAALEGNNLAPVFAQQSVRENARTGRTPQVVLADAIWGLLDADWRSPWGADADHIKEIAELAPFLEAGYSFYTLDPNEYVDNAAQEDSLEGLESKVSQMPWASLGISWEALRRLYLGERVELDRLTLEFTNESLYRAVAKYGRAIAHIKTISDYLVGKLAQFDLEVSVDETDTPTSVHEHYYLASELRRLQVPFVSLAPRFVGSFEKGVDYVGDLAEFDRELQKHAAVMRAVGGYKLSIHTGSDKFSIYPSIAAQTRNLVHVKTAGTSYLEALRVIAATDPEFFREILDFSRAHYPTDRASYYVSGELENVPDTQSLSDHQLLDLFGLFDSRQVLHVTYGSVLDAYGPRLYEALLANLELYEQYLKTHFQRHLGLLL